MKIPRSETRDALDLDDQLRRAASDEGFDVTPAEEAAA
jgi:hypothetical protein